MKALIINTKSDNAFKKPLCINNEKFCMIHLPAIVIEKKRIEPSVINRLINKIPTIDFVIISSVNSLLHSPKEIIETLRKNQTAIASVGEISGKLAREYSLNLKIISPSTNLDGLTKLRELMKANHFLFLKGEGGNMSMIHSYQSQGKNVSILETYNRVNLFFESSMIDMIMSQKCLWLLYSKSALMSIYHNFRNDSKKLSWLFAQDVLCFSQSICQKAKEIGFRGNILQMKEMKNNKVLKKINYWVANSSLMNHD